MSNSSTSTVSTAGEPKERHSRQHVSADEERRGQAALCCAIGDAVSMNSADAPPPPRIVRLVGVYDADSTFRGELSYWVGARLGRRHCSLCDITHGLVRERPEWSVCRASLPIPFDAFHRNDQPRLVREAAGGRVPVVVAETDRRHVLLLTPTDLDACDGSIEQLMEAIERAAVRLGLNWTVP
jgi:hypothetical protein